MNKPALNNLDASSHSTAPASLDNPVALRRTVLLVEDNPLDARLLHELLTDAASRATSELYEVVNVRRLQEALDMVRERSFDVILLDLSLPDSQGLESFERLFAIASDTPIAVMTGLNDDALALLAVQKGAQDYFVKGQVSTPLLVRSLRYAIERHRMQSQLRKLSLVDEMTGLYNRRGFLTLADQQLKTSQRSGGKVWMFFADLDGMKLINDNFGHSEGDWAIIKTAEILRGTFRESDIIARFGGDEFTVLATLNDNDADDKILERLQNNTRALNEKYRRPFSLRISVGSAHFNPKTIRSIEHLMSEADKALYEQKRHKRHDV
ncbi:MAG: hypothetical protein JWN98_2650 [Abditibacteriota bacterium]|nr:hypothetical protein [Abditibacteriota bacterium]